MFKVLLNGVAEISLSAEEGVGTGSPSKFVEKSLISRQTLGLFNALDLTQTFDSTFHQFADSTGACRDFLG